MAAYPLLFPFRAHLAALLLAGILARCGHSPAATNSSLPSDPEALWRLINERRWTDDPPGSTTIGLAEQAYQPHSSYPESWRWKFRLRHVELLLDKGNVQNAEAELKALESAAKTSGLPKQETAARLSSAQGYFAYRSGQYQRAATLYDEALAGLATVRNDPCWEAELQVQHKAQNLRILRKFDLTKEALKKGTAAAKACPGRALEALIPYTEGLCYNDNFQYEEAVNSFQKCRRLVQDNHILQLAANTKGTLGLCYYNLGDTDHALEMFDETDSFYRSRARPLTNREIKDWEHHKGHRARTYLLLKLYAEAERAYAEAITDAEKIQDADYLNLWRTELTSLYLETGKLDLAQQLNAQVIKDKDNDIDPFAGDRAYLIEARLNRLQKRYQEAQTNLDHLQRQAAIRKDPKIVWQIHSERALVFDAINRLPAARREFEAALASAGEALAPIKEDRYRLTNFSQLRSVYQSYVDFLVQHNQPVQALRIAELGHARLLAEKLKTPAPGPAFDFRQIARAKKAVILSYSITPLHSYMWVTTSTSISMFPLPAEDVKKLEALIANHNFAIHDDLRPDDVGGEKLYEILIGRAAEAHLIPPQSNVIVIPDGPLSALNFETLIPGGQKRYWLESVTITVAPSLALISTQPQRAFDPESILLVGDAIPSSQEKLIPLGHDDLDYVNNLYPGKCRMLRQQTATPREFLQAASAKQYSWIYLSAHAKSFPQSPLDSYVVLSPETTGGEYRLSARDLAQLKLKADLVTLSACRSAGAKNVPGEGLVGLSWAVLNTYSRNVVASLWDVPADSTTKLMKKFYSHLHAHESPSEALRSAKVEMIQAKELPNSWAGFQLYSR